MCSILSHGIRGSTFLNIVPSFFRCSIFIPSPCVAPDNNLPVDSSTDFAILHLYHNSKDVMRVEFRFHRQKNPNYNSTPSGQTVQTSQEPCTSVSYLRRYAISLHCHRRTREKKSLMNMACLAVFILLLLISFCKSDDQLTHAKPLSPGNMLISQDGAFALGFFSPSSPTNTNRSLYVGIWYHNIPQRTVVWIANRDNPITTPSSAKLVVTNTSDLALSDSKGRTLWTTTNHVTTGGTGAAAVLLNSGNLVLQSPPNGTTLWQSFDHPTDTILPNMPFLLSSKGRIAQRIVSWKGPDDPSTGEFSFGGDPSSNLQLLLLHGTSPYWRQKPWNSAATTGEYQTNTNSLLYAAVFMREDDMYLTFSGSLNMRLTLDYTGMLKSLIWNSSSSSWTAFDERPGHGCERYASCGPFGYCDNTAAEPTCKCLDGFKPAGLNFSRGCLRKEALKCGGEDHFVTLTGMKVPDKFLYIRNRSFDQCAAECSSNCSCTAYAYANLSMEGASGDLSRCLVWMVDLVDTATNSHGAENLYLRLARSPVQKKSDLVKIVLPAIACLLIFTFVIGLVRICKYKGKQRKKEIQKRLMLGFSSAPNELAGENIEFPFISFEDVIAATDNFCESNILGKGGFGKVYKGMLGGDKEVAIKRLSRGSGQGIEEFRNEVVLIAKLQHRNLVRLLGCCIHEDEKLLIYEYLPNKSLDAFLFDVTRNSMLDWPTRFKIIKGIARGLLYLHQDSRLTIIHRDLKASNILLDAEMNPKISDFGMARIFGGNQQQANTCRVVGTYGYMSPEYVTGGAFSVKSDTYSFGVLLLEIVSGLKISSPQLIINFPNLIAYAWILWEEGNARELVDSSVVESCPIHEVLRCIHVGLLCVQNHPNARPLMSSVVFMLENETTLLSAPKQPAYFAPRNYENGDKGEIIEKSSNTMSFTTLDGR